MSAFIFRATRALRGRQHTLFRGCQRQLFSAAVEQSCDSAATVQLSYSAESSDSWFRSSSPSNVAVQPRQTRWPSWLFGAAAAGLFSRASLAGADDDEDEADGVSALRPHSQLLHTCRFCWDGAPVKSLKVPWIPVRRSTPCCELHYTSTLHNECHEDECCIANCHKGILLRPG